MASQRSNKMEFLTDADAAYFMKNIGEVDFDSFPNDASRRQALGTARALARRLETPVDSVWNVALLYPALYSALKVALDTNIFDKLDYDDGRPKTTEELAQSADSDVIKRMLRHLAAMDFLHQPEPDLWSPTRFTSQLRKPDVFASIDYLFDISGPAFLGLPHYLRETDFKNPTDVMNGNWQYVTEPNKSHFEWMAEHSGSQKTFWNLMKGYASQPGSWVDVFPTSTIVADNKTDVPLIVDIGGAEGRDMQNFLEKHPESVGRLIFQDQEPVIKDAEYQREKGLVPMVYDFFTPQEIKGARVYFMHRVLHDWPDEKGLEILANLKPAMAKGYSRLLINEIVIPRTNANWHQTSVDLMMMALLSSRERSEQSWERFLEAAGFRVVKFWQSLAAYENVIEAEPV